MSRKRLSKEARRSLQLYYWHRLRQSSATWDKLDDLEAIEQELRKCKNFQSFEASAGTFLIWWKDGVQTVHNKKDYWQEKVFTRTKAKVCTQYRELSGDAIIPKTARRH